MKQENALSSEKFPKMTTASYMLLPAEAVERMLMRGMTFMESAQDIGAKNVTKEVNIPTEETDTLPSSMMAMARG